MIWAGPGDDVAKMHAAVGIKSLYRGVSKDDPSKVCAVMQAQPGVMEQFIADNRRWGKRAPCSCYVL